MVQHGSEHRVVGGQAGHADPPALEVARAADAGAGDHRGERALHERAHAHQVLAALAGEREVVDVHDREVGAARGSSFSESVEADGTRISRFTPRRSSAASLTAV